MNSIRIKVRLAFTLVGLVALCGCAHQYLITLRNGDQILCRDQPKLQGTTYHFTDRTGGKDVIAQSRVLKVRAVSVVNAEQKPAIPASPVKPKKPRHWYFLWLA
jgi:hypothetical protein